MLVSRDCCSAPRLFATRVSDTPTATSASDLPLTSTLFWYRRVAGVNAGPQLGVYTSFPYCQCKAFPTAYSIAQAVNAKGNGTYCFTLQVATPPGCTDYCCTKADLKKIEVRRLGRVCPKANRAGVVARGGSPHGSAWGCNPDRAPAYPERSAVLLTSALPLRSPHRSSTPFLHAMSGTRT